jgi:hypothetical protein
MAATRPTGKALLPPCDSWEGFSAETRELSKIVAFAGWLV